MRLVQMRDGALEIRWTWLPLWLGLNPKLKGVVEREMRDACLLGGVTTADTDLDALHTWVAKRLQRLFPGFPGLDQHLDSLRAVQEPATPQ